MALKITPETKGQDAKTRAFLNKYIATAVELMGGKSLGEARLIAKEMVKKTDLNTLKTQDVEAKRAEVKQDLKGFGMREKMAYYSDAAQINTDKKAAKAVLTPAIAACAVGMTSVCLGSVEGALGAMAGGTAYVVARSTMAFLGDPMNKKEADENKNYSDLKHAHLALKKLENALLKKECKEMKQEAYRKGLIPPVSGYGIGY